MGIAVENVSKRFGDFAALDDVSLDVPRRLADRAARPERRRQVDAAAGDRRPRGAGRGPGAHRRRGRDRRARAQARRRLRVPALRRLQAHDGARQRRLRAEDPQAPEGGDRGAGGASCSSSCTWTASPSRYPAQLSGGQRQRMALARALAVRAQGAAARRAVRRARRDGAQGAARLAAPPPRRGARDDDLRDPRPGGGDGGRRADRGAERRAGSSRSARRATSTSSRPTSS